MITGSAFIAFIFSSKTWGWMVLSAELNSTKGTHAYAFGCSRCLRMRCPRVLIALSVPRSSLYANWHGSSTSLTSSYLPPDKTILENCSAILGLHPPPPPPPHAEVRKVWVPAEVRKVWVPKVRKVWVPAEVRKVWVPAEVRKVWVPAEVRKVWVSSEVRKALLKSGRFESLLKSGRFESLLKSGRFESLLNSGRFESVLKSARFQLPLKLGSFESLLKTRRFEAWRRKNFESLLTTGNCELLLSWYI